MRKIIAIDGLDGSGKATQVSLLKQRLDKLGYNVRVASFPAYDNKSSALVKMYLGGEISDNINDINPYAASLFYACDRYVQFMTNLKETDKDEILLCDRYISANILHQGAKIEDLGQRRKYYDWVYEIEHLIGVPKETATIMLLVHPEISQKLMVDCTKTKVEGDIHEKNLEYLQNCYDKAESAAQYNGWYTIDCSPNKQLKSIKEINDLIYEYVLTKIQ